MFNRRSAPYLLGVACVVLLGTLDAYAQTGKLKVRVSPKQAYVFVDSNAIREGGRTLRLSAGKHTVGAYNYGYKPQIREVTISEGQTSNLDFTLEAAGGAVSGPWGRIQIKGADRAAVLLNGKTPDYFVGHGDEFNNDFIWKQELIVPAGTHQVTLTHEGKEIWSGQVTVGANQRVVIDARKGGSPKTTAWPRGEKLSNLPRFRAGLVTTTVAVAPVSGKFSADNTQINCGDSSRLSWSSAETVEAEVSGLGKVPTTGDQSVQPKQTTTYNFRAAGPGGVVESSATVNVNTAVQASLSVSPAEVRYRRIGDKVLEQGSSTVTWSTGNADSVSLDPFGTVSASGNRSVQAAPKQTGNGPVDETVNYTLKATNVCGGSETRSAALHIAGSIEPIPEVTLTSVFFPTDYPEEKNPDFGLLRSQQEPLVTLAAGFKKYLEYDPDAKLSLEGHADDRGSDSHNEGLSDRRAARVKQFLVGQGISGDKIQTKALGKAQELDRDAVKQLEDQNPNKAPEKRLRRKRENWLAYNRRVDIVLLPSGKQSSHYYPHNAADSQVLWQMPKPRSKAVQENQ